MIQTGEGIDWAMASARLPVALVTEATKIRLSVRIASCAPFPSRHSVLYDQETEERYIPLATCRRPRHATRSSNSMLSEEAVLGFEYGYSLARRTP